MDQERAAEAYSPLRIQVTTSGTVIRWCLTTTLDKASWLLSVTCMLQISREECSAKKATEWADTSKKLQFESMRLQRDTDRLKSHLVMSQYSQNPASPPADGFWTDDLKRPYTNMFTEYMSSDATQVLIILTITGSLNR